jgi:PGF-CTERM protein
MKPQRIVPVLLIASLVASSVGAAALASTGTVADTRQDPATETTAASNGENVSFEVQNNAVVEYVVDGETVLSSVKTESAGTYESRSGVNAAVELNAVVDVEGSGLDVESESSTRTEIHAESGARMSAHDNERGVLVVGSNDGEQVVEAQLTSETEARQTSDGHVVVEDGDGEVVGTFVVVGEGNTTVAEDGDVTAHVREEGSLAFRAYPDERTEEDEQREKMIANGTAMVEVFASSEAAAEAESGGEESGDSANGSAYSAVSYSQDTSAEARQESSDRVSMTVDRASEEGTVVVTHVSEAAVESTENLTVTVDGEAAVRAESMAELRQATNDGDTSKYMVRQKANGEAAVYVAVNHFSERNVAIQSGDEESTSTNADDEGESDGSPGFGVGAGVLALIGAALVAKRRQG